MRNRLNRAVVLAACAVALGACSESGTPVPGAPTTGSTTATTTTSAGSGENGDGAPTVENPLSPEPLVADPCKSLSAAQAQALGLQDKPTPGDKDEFDTLGPYCNWYDTAKREFFTIGFLTPNENGLSDIYRGQEQGQWAYFEPTTVSGYPAVFEDIGDRRSRGSCNIAVGVTDELAFNVRVSRATPANEACDAVKEVAGAVIETLKNGG